MNFQIKILTGSVLAAICFVATGCGPSTAELNGKVTCKGKPVTNADILFSPVGDGNPGKPAKASLDANGEFKLTEVLVGEHKVTLHPTEDDDDNQTKIPCKPPNDFTFDVVEGSNEFKLEM